MAEKKDGNQTIAETERMVTELAERVKAWKCWSVRDKKTPWDAVYPTLKKAIETLRRSFLQSQKERGRIRYQLCSIVDHLDGLGRKVETWQALELLFDMTNWVVKYCPMQLGYPWCNGQKPDPEDRYSFYQIVAESAHEAGRHDIALKASQLLLQHPSDWTTAYNIAVASLWGSGKKKSAEELYLCGLKRFSHGGFVTECESLESMWERLQKQGSIRRNDPPLKPRRRRKGNVQNRPPASWIEATEIRGGRLGGQIYLVISKDNLYSFLDFDGKKSKECLAPQVTRTAQAIALLRTHGVSQDINYDDLIEVVDVSHKEYKSDTKIHNDRIRHAVNRLNSKLKEVCSYHVYTNGRLGIKLNPNFPDIIVCHETPLKQPLGLVARPSDDIVDNDKE